MQDIKILLEKAGIHSEHDAGKHGISRPAYFRWKAGTAKPRYDKYKMLVELAEKRQQESQATAIEEERSEPA